MKEIRNKDRRNYMFRENMEIFDCFTVSVLSELYERFPVKTKIDGYETVGKCKYLDGSEIDILERTLILKSTFEFLEENNFIKYEGNIDSSCVAFDCVLTIKGLNVLNKEPESINKKATVGQNIRGAIKTGAYDVAIGYLKQVLIN
jgi:hypothetical protein